MRTSYLFALLGTTALALSGCSSVDKVTTTSISATDNATTGTTGEDATGNVNATSTGQNNTTGSKSFAFNDNAFAVTGSGRTDVNVTNDGGGINVETASVSVNTGFSEMTWADTIEMNLFKTTVDTPAMDGLHLGANFSGYKEYRRINSTTDAELQIWSYTYSQVGQYTVYFAESAANQNNVSLFHDGDLTPTSALPAGTATYNGKFGGTAVTSNWLIRPRTVGDPFNADPSQAIGQDWDPNGTWRVTGDVQVNADFGAGSVNGVINNLTWRKFDPDVGYITIGTAEVSRPFHDYTFNGTMTGSTYTGNTRGPNSVVTGNNALNGAFYGPNAEETAGVVFSETTNPGPQDGRSPYEENRRGFITLRGVFQGNR